MGYFNGKEEIQATHDAQISYENQQPSAFSKNCLSMFAKSMID